MSGTVTVNISNIVRLQDLQVRSRLNPEAVKQYASVYQAGTEMPPIRLAKVNGSLMLIDGWHRLAALERIGRFSADAEVVEVATLAEAGWLAAQANMKHGLPLKARELREVFRAYVRAGRHITGKGRPKTFRVIAQELGGRNPHTTIHQWMQKDFPRIAALYRSADAMLTNRGGQRSAPGAPTMLAEASKTIDQVMLMFRGIVDERERGALIAHVETLLSAMKAAGAWVAPASNDGDYDF